VAADLLDERLIASEGFAGYARLQANRLRSGDLGNLPVILGLVIISIGFYLKNPVFLSSYNVVSITQFAAPIGVISLGIVLVLLLGEIDLSVGSVSGVSLAGLLGFQGLLLYILGSNGTINLPRDSFLAEFTRTKFVGDVASYVLVALVVLVYLGSQLWTYWTRDRADLSTPWLPMVLVKTALLALGLGYATYYVNIDRGFTYLWIFFVLLVIVMDFALRRTRWGRHLFAVGGNVEAARRSGIKVDRVYISVFALTSMLAAVGGLLAAGLRTSVSQASGTTDTNLTAIAAAVIGGTSLFGGRGSAYSALLGILVLQAITSGLNLIHVDSSVRFMVTGAVLLVAVAIDSVSRRARSSSGRG
jgi:D-xylose transport system permease protein